MSRPAFRPFVRTLLAASLLVGAVPACSAGGFGLFQRTPTTDASGNVVYRPVYTAPGLRPASIVPGGYAGVVYPPVGFGRGVNPTRYDVAQPAGGCPAPRRWGWWRR